MAYFDADCVIIHARFFDIVLSSFAGDAVDPAVKLLGAGAFAFHPTLEWMFVGDRSGTLLAWDVSVPSRPSLIGM